MVTLLTKTYSYFYDIAIELGLMEESDILDPTKEIRVLRFSYVKDDIFQEVRKRTLFLAKMRSTDVNLVNLISLTQDEMSLFEPFYTQTIMELSKQLQPLSRNINAAMLDLHQDIETDKSTAVVGSLIYDNGIVYKALFENSKDEPFTDDFFWQITTEFCFNDKIVFFTEHLEWMKLNSMQISDNYLFESLVLGIMYNWLMFSYPQEAQTYYLQYQSKLAHLSASLNSSGPWKRKYSYP